MKIIKVSAQIGLMGLFLLAMPIRTNALDPAKITSTNFRGEAVSAASEDVFYRGDTIHWTNCVVYAGTGTTYNTALHHSTTGSWTLTKAAETAIGTPLIWRAVQVF